jgi:hypothetical protein
MKKLTQIVILFIVIMILSSLTFINIFKESFEDELSVEEKNIINNLSIYNTKIGNLQKLLPELNKNYNLVKDDKINDNKIKNSTSSLTNINSTNLTIKNQLDYIKNILGTGSFHVIKKLGINTDINSSPILSNANLLEINNVKPIVTTPAYQPLPTPAYQPLPTPGLPMTPYETVPTPSYEQLPSISLPTPAYEADLDSPSELENESSNQSISTFMNVAKKSKESFINLLNSMPVRKPVEHFTEPDNWREEWNSKLDSISRTISLPLSDTNPKINDNETSFYIVQNPNLEKNLENTSSNIIKMQMENMTEILRDKWIKINRK